MVIVCGTTAAAAGPLSRPSKQEARDHLDRGNRLYNTRSFEEAVVEFKAGALVEPAPVFDYNLGQAYRQMGKYEDALWHYDRFLTYGQPTGDLLNAVKAFMTEMRAHLANRARTMPPNEPAPGPVNETNSLAASQAVTPNPGAPLLNERPRPMTPVEESPGPNWLGWGMTGAGVVAIGTGAAFLVSASNLNADANRNPDQRAGNSQYDKAHTRDVVGFVIGGAGIALTVAGVVDLFVGHSHEHAERATSLRLGVSDHELFVIGSF
jgi:hypothetical protein